MLEANERVVTRYIEDELKDSYLTYAMSVIVNRAIPDVRDGLKPSTRRILFSMYELNLFHNRPHKKSARIVGEVMGKYHPHGDGPIYDTLVGMAQDFSLRYPLVDGQGNWGSVDGDKAGAMRYTEARLSAIAEEMLEDLDKETVDFQPNFDDSLEEPTVLPAKLPDLLINGTTGIAVGYMTKIPTHNLREVIDGIITILENPNSSIDELRRSIQGPDFPTGGIIVGREGIKEAYETGKGHISVRAKAFIERDKVGAGKESIVISEIPYQVSKSALIEKIAEVVNEKNIEGISDLRDESDKEGTRIVIELKRGEIAQVILNQLYKHTQMQTTFNVIMLCLVDGQPKMLNLKQMIQHYLDHRREIVRKRTQFELRKSERRAHILEGLRIALNNIEAVIDIAEAAASPKEAKEQLISRFQLSELQADEILSMTLQRLTGLERRKINEEYTELLVKIEEFRAILASEILVRNIIKEELIELKRKYGDDRRTQIIEAEGEFQIEDLIADEEMVITISNQGYIKRIPVTTYRTQRRGGVGVIGMETKEDDFVEHIFVATAHQYILFFTNKGKCYWLKVFEIPEASRISRGRAIVNLLKLSSEEGITAFVPVREFEEDLYLFMATKSGIVKRCELREFSRPYSSGIIAINLREDDELISVKLTEGDEDVIMVTGGGMSIKFSESEVRSMGRTAAGVKGIELEAGDWVVAMDVARESTGLLAVTENGYGKRTDVSEHRVQGRAGKGVIAIKTSDRNGNVVAVKTVVDGDELMVMSSNGMITRICVDDIRMIGRNTQGVKIMSLQPEEKVVAVAKIAAKDGDEADEETKDNALETV